MVLNTGDCVNGPCLNDGTVPNLSQIEVGLGFSGFLEVVMQRGIKDGELDSDVVQVLVRRLEGILPVFATTEDVVGFRGFTDVRNEVPNKLDIDAVPSKGIFIN